jgi:hypothetical protein
MGWFTRERASGDGRRETVMPAAAPVAAVPPLLHWLLDTPPAAEPGPSAAEQRALHALDTWSRTPTAAGEGLPRPRTLLPQLLALLRRDDVALGQLAQQVARDGALVAEVLRLARAVARGGSGDPVDLSQAIARLGRSGLNAAIARVLLRPLFDASGDGLLARASARLWQHAEVKAQRCSALAPPLGVDPFEAYLAGLLHNSGWAAVLHALDRDGARGPSPAPLPRRCTPGFAAALPARCDRFFGRLGWDVTAPLAALADAARTAGGLEHSDLPLAVLLRQVDAATTTTLAAPPRAA